MSFFSKYIGIIGSSSNCKIRCGDVKNVTIETRMDVPLIASLILVIIAKL
jgi:hypothetical protein